MVNIKQVILYLALTQLASCAVMSEKECLSADWKQEGYEVGLTGDTNKAGAFSAREKMCSKYGESANLALFNEGHADGIVQFCQLSNAVELGVKGADNVISENVCPEFSYPGFRKSFDVGYQLYLLRSRVKENSNVIAGLNSQATRAQRDIGLLNRQIGNKGKDNSLNRQLGYEFRQAKNNSAKLDRQIEKVRKLQAQDKAAVRDYQEYVYQDYLANLSDEFIDPRVKQAPKKKQSEFDDRIDEVLNEPNF